MMARIIPARECRNFLLGGEPQLTRRPRDAECGGKEQGDASTGGLVACMSQQRRVCAVCGSRRFRLIASQLVCDAGHIQRDFRIEAAHDDDGFDTQITTRTRSLNRASQRDSERAEKRQRAHEQRRKIHGRTMYVFPGSFEHFSLSDPDAARLHGPRVMFAIVQAYQLILRKQIEALRKYMGDDCPCMLEAYARDFWAMHVSNHHIPAAPLEAAQDAAERRERDVRRIKPECHDSARRGRQRYQDESDVTWRLEPVTLKSTLAIVFLACVMCRVPITLGDMRKHVITRTLPYLNAIRYLPTSLTDSLSLSDLQFGGLDTNHIPSVMELHRRVVDISSVLQKQCGVMWPEMNAAPVLSRYVHAFMLPSTLYVMSKALLTMLRIDMHVRGAATLTPNAAARAREAQHDKEWLSASCAFSRNTLVPRCVMLMAVLIVAIKLRYGLDGMERQEVSTTVQGRQIYSGAPRQAEWLDTVCALHGTTHSTSSFAPWDTSVDVLTLSEEDMDTYLDFVEDMYLPTHIPASLPLRRRDDVDDLIPCEPPARRERGDWLAYARYMEAQHAERRKQFEAELYAGEPTTECETDIAPGEAYALHTHDPGGTMSRDMHRVLETGMRIVGLDTHPLPTYQPSNTAWTRPHDQDVLLDCVMQLEEALVTTLMRRRRR